MNFNLNTPWTNSNVAALLASVTDDRIWRIVVDKVGNVSLLDCSGPTPNLNTWHCYFETWIPSSGYVGQSAAADARHVSSIAGALRRNWPALERDAYIDDY